MSAVYVKKFHPLSRLYCRNCDEKFKECPKKSKRCKECRTRARQVEEIIIDIHFCPKCGGESYPNIFDDEKSEQILNIVYRVERIRDNYDDAEKDVEFIEMLGELKWWDFNKNNIEGALILIDRETDSSVTGILEYMWKNAPECENYFKEESESEEESEEESDEDEESDEESEEDEESDEESEEESDKE